MNEHCRADRTCRPPEATWCKRRLPLVWPKHSDIGTLGVEWNIRESATITHLA